VNEKNHNFALPKQISLMKKLLIAVALVGMLVGCKTTEENYRQAYEKAISGRTDDIDTTLYGGFRREMAEQGVVTQSGEKIAVRTVALSLVDADEAPVPLEKYSVVVGQFKQVFNARSMRDRLANAGFNNAEVIKTSEPFYYVITSTHAKVESADSAMKALSGQKLPITLSDPLPFIISNLRRH
jgi:hypothetical protein